MTIIYFDGFDNYIDGNTMARRGWVPGSANLQTPPTGRFTGSKAMQLGSGNTNQISRAFTATATISIGFALKCQNLSAFSANGGEVIRLRNGGTDILRFGVTQDGRLRLGRADFTSNLVCGSVPSVIATNSYAYIELEITRHASAGAATIYVNGVSVATASGVNTGASDIDTIGFSGGFTVIDIDDFYMTNTATKLGEMRCEYLPPTADTATKDFSRSTGANNFANVDEIQPNDDTDYNFSSTVGHKDLFDLTDLSSTPSSIKAVQPLLVARKDNAGARTTRTNLKSGATTANGTTNALSVAYMTFNDIYENNPDTSAPWTGSEVNAAQLGYELVA